MIERHQARRPNVGASIHFHAVDDGEVILTAQTIKLYGFVQTKGHGVPRTTGIKLGDFTAPVR